MTKRKRTLHEAAHKAGVRWNLKHVKPWPKCCIYGNGYLAGYRAGKKEGKAEAMAECGWGDGRKRKNA